MKARKKNFIHLIQLLSSSAMQDRYQAEVDVDIYDELLCMRMGFYDEISSMGLADVVDSTKHLINYLK